MDDYLAYLYGEKEKSPRQSMQDEKNHYATNQVNSFRVANEAHVANEALLQAGLLLDTAQYIEWIRAGRPPLKEFADKQR